MATTFDYSRKSFTEIRQLLLNYIKDTYPEIYNDFNQDSSINSVLLELVAALGDNLYYAIDRSANEVFVEQAQTRKALFNLSKTLGSKIPNIKPSITVCEFTVSVPANGDTFSTEYLPIIKYDTTIESNGITFQPVGDIDFSSNLSFFGTNNRKILPRIENGQVIDYQITKTEMVISSSIRTFTQTVREDNIQPFLKLTLPETNIVDILAVIVKPNINNTSLPTEQDYINEDYLFYEVDYLAENQVFVENTNFREEEIKSGYWKNITKKFIKEFDENGFCSITFGGGNGDLNYLTNSLKNINGFDKTKQYLYNTALGEIPNINSTIYIKYRIGGGKQANVSANSIRTVVNNNMFVNGTNPVINQRVINSLRVNNTIPAFGGRDSLSNEEIRNFIKYNFSENGTCLTTSDYMLRLQKMEGKYGLPFRTTVFEENNKIIISILGIDSNNKLDNQSTSILKENISEYLSKFRPMNDYVEVRDGQIINLAYDFTLLIDNRSNPTEILPQVILAVNEFHDINNNFMDDDLFLGNLIEKINNINGVLNINSYVVYNKVNGQYSINTINMPLTKVDDSTFKIDVQQSVLLSSKDAMFEVKFPEKDIRINFKRITI
jgi:hypothetical protein